MNQESPGFIHGECQYCPKTKRHYALIPFTMYSNQFCHCSSFKGCFEAEAPVRAGSSYLLDGVPVTAGKRGKIVDPAKKEAYENQDVTLFRLKPQYVGCPEYDWIADTQLFMCLFDYMELEHFEKVTFKRKEIICMFGSWYLNPKEQKGENQDVVCRVS